VDTVAEHAAVAEAAGGAVVNAAADEATPAAAAARAARPDRVLGSEYVAVFGEGRGSGPSGRRVAGPQSLVGNGGAMPDADAAASDPAGDFESRLACTASAS
jgi:hypothetical protein